MNRSAAAQSSPTSPWVAPNLAAQAMAAGLVDEYQLFVAPVVVSGGTRTRPDGLRLNLELVDEHRFDNGMAYLKYRSAR